MLRLMLLAVLFPFAINASAGLVVIPDKAADKVFATSYIMQVCPALWKAPGAKIYIREMSLHGWAVSNKAWNFIRACDAVGAAKTKML